MRIKWAVLCEICVWGTIGVICSGAMLVFGMQKIALINGTHEHIANLHTHTILDNF